MAPEGYGHGYQSYVTLYSPDQPTLANVAAQNAGRNHLMARLESKGIATRQGTHAAALTGYYARKYALTPAHFPNAYLAEQLTVALPLYAGLREDEVTEICDVLAEVDAE